MALKLDTSFSGFLTSAVNFFFGDRNNQDDEESGFDNDRRQDTKTGPLTAIPAAYACINIMTAITAGLPKVAVEIEEIVDDFFEALPNHRVTELLRFPSSMIDPAQFWRFMLRQLFTHGNGYAYIRRNAAGLPEELVPAGCNSAQWEKLRDGRIMARYNLSLMGNPLEANVDTFSPDVVALHGPGFDGLSSPSPVLHAARGALETIGLSIGHQKNILKGVNVRTAITTQSGSGGAIANLDPAQKEQIRDEIKRAYREQARGGAPPIFEPGWQLSSAQGSLSASDLQLIETIKWSVEEVARIWGVPPRMIGHYHQGFRVATTVEAQAVDFERYTITPPTEMIGEQLATKLFTAQERIERDLSVRLITNKIARGSYTERLRAAGQAFANFGLLNRDEARRTVGKGKSPNGDKFMTPKGAGAPSGNPGQK